MGGNNADNFYVFCLSFLLPVLAVLQNVLYQSMINAHQKQILEYNQYNDRFMPLYS